jgi:hypoxanthine phosphoribosyltransferase
VAPKVALDFLTIRQRLLACDLPDVDRVVGIGSGGVVPAALAAYQLARPLSILPINFRAANNKPRYEKPQILGEITLPTGDQRLLLVDDVSVSGRTLAVAKEVLSGHQVTTLVMKGQADIVLFPEVGECVQWPWKPPV